MGAWRRRLVAVVSAVVLLLAACSQPRLSIEEFCDLSREIDIETTKLVQLPPVGAEFEQQRDLIRNMNDRRFTQAPEEIAEVADELGPMLTATDADNERVVQLLEVFEVYVLENCSGGNSR